MAKIKRVEPEVEVNYRYAGTDALVEVANESYGHKLRRLRLLLGLTQVEVADMVGCAPESLGVWESGKRHGVTPEAAVLPRRAIALLSQRLRGRRARANGTQ